MNEKIGFSNRLRAAMVKAGYVASPLVLEQRVQFALVWAIHQQPNNMKLT
jgi:hypothetical protein